LRSVNPTHDGRGVRDFDGGCSFLAISPIRRTC
jgi:hypothetical protein